MKVTMFDDMNDEANTPDDAPSDTTNGRMELREEFCHEIGGCDKCPPSISKHCDETFKAMKDWETPQEPKDSPRGWIKLKTTKRTIYFDASRIAALGDVTNATALAAGAVTAVYTVGAETDVLYVCDSIDEIVEKIEKASQEQENEYYANA